MLNFLQTFATRWDGHSYLMIVQNGYVREGVDKNFIVFPPFYPLIVKIINYIVNNISLSGFLVSTFSIALGLFIFYKLLKLDYSKNKSMWTLLTVIIFPTSYFFVSMYPESLFFLLIIGSLYFARIKKFPFAAILGGLATLTRPFGILIWPSIFIEWLQDKNKNYLDLLTIIIVPICSSLIYLSLNYALFGNPLQFEVFLQSHWQKSFSSPWSGIISSWQRGIYTPSSNFEYKYVVGFAEAFAATLSYLLIFINLAFKKLRMRFSYLTYLILATLFMTSTSFLLSTPRYLLSIPPFFITLSQISNSKIIKIIWIILSITLLTCFTSLFARGHWAF